MRAKIKKSFELTFRRLELHRVLHLNVVEQFRRDAISLYFLKYVAKLCPPDGIIACFGGFGGGPCPDSYVVNLHTDKDPITRAGLLQFDHAAVGVDPLRAEWHRQIRICDAAVGVHIHSWRQTSSDPDLLLHHLFGLEPARLHTGLHEAAVILRCLPCHATMPVVRSGSRRVW